MAYKNDNMLYGIIKEKIMSFLDYNHEDIDHMIMNIEIGKLLKIFKIEGQNINQKIYENKTLLECVIEMFNKNNDKNIILKLLRKIMLLITKGARSPQLCDPNILVSIIAKCSMISNRVNFQLIKCLAKIFGPLHVDITFYINNCDDQDGKIKKMWQQVFTHITIIREHQNCINHIQSRNLVAFINNFKLMISLFNEDYTNNVCCFHNISQELSEYNWDSDELVIAPLCFNIVLDMYPRMVCNIIINIENHINIPNIIELCSKYYESSHDQTLLYELHSKFVSNTITKLLIDTMLYFLINPDLVLVFNPDFPVKRSLINELLATRELFNNELLSYFEVTLFDRKNT